MKKNGMAQAGGLFGPRRRSVLLSALLCLSLAIPAPAREGASLSPEVSAREQRNSDLSMELATQGMVLLENRDETLPISPSGNVAVLGPGARRTVKGGSGSGDVNQRETVSVAEGLTRAGLHVTTTSYMLAYEEAQKQAEEAVDAGFWGTPRAQEIPLTSRMKEEAARDTDTCIYLLTRNAGEGTDRTNTPGDYQLTAVEQENLSWICRAFSRVILVINAGGAVDTTFLQDMPEIGAVLVMGQAGQRGGDALAQVLTGRTPPSGRLTATWPRRYEDVPDAASWGSNDGNVVQEDYTDGIYVGYRYYDTFGVTPAYPFGYGLGYTDFDTELLSVEADSDTVTVRVRVTNTGDRWPGRQVVQVYASAPAGDLEKPFQELAAFGKTASLEPGQSQDMVLSFATTELSSYSEALSAYVMEAGDYVIRVGENSRSTHVAALLRLDETVVTEQLSPQLAPDHPLTERSREKAAPWTYEGEAEEIEAASVLSLAAADFRTENHASPYDDENVSVYVSDTTETAFLNEALGYPLTGKYHDHPDYQEQVVSIEGDYSGSTLLDVYEGRVSPEAFVSGLTVSQMADLVIGGSKLATANGQSLGASSPNLALTPESAIRMAQQNAVSGDAGETAGIYISSKAIPNLILADGPAGLRITLEEQREGGGTWYQFCTAFPSGTVMAQTWDPEALTAMGDAVGEELEEYGVTIWLAPGLNIQKNPLCGRNFEYFSEDPFLSGILGIAQTLGVQSHPGIGVCIKHLYGNNQEENRSAVNNTISERASREIYLKQFEMVVKGAAPLSIMTAYNTNNSVPSADDYDLCTDVIRGEWGFSGFIMCDWGGGQSTPSISMHAGNDLIMPGSSVEDITLRAFGDEPPCFAPDSVYPEVTVTEDWFGLQAVTAWGEFRPDEKGTAVIRRSVSKAAFQELPVPAMRNGVQTTIPVREALEELGGAVQILEEKDTVTVLYRGSYPDNNISLGDLQKSVLHLLPAFLASSQFAELFPDRVTPVPWSEGRSLKEYLTIHRQ